MRVFPATALYFTAQLSSPVLCVRTKLPPFPGINTFMASLLTSRTCDELPATTEKPYWHVLTLVWNARVRSGDLLSRGARRQHGARVRQVRGTRQLFGASRIASLVAGGDRSILELSHSLSCSILDTRPTRMVL